MSNDNTTATVAADFKYKLRQATIPATATTRREIAIVDMAENPLFTVPKGKRLFGEVRGDGFFYFVWQDVQGVRGTKETECRIPFNESLIAVEYGREGESESNDENV